MNGPVPAAAALKVYETPVLAAGGVSEPNDGATMAITVIWVTEVPLAFETSMLNVSVPATVAVPETVDPLWLSQDGRLEPPTRFQPEKGPVPPVISVAMSFDQAEPTDT